MGRAKSGFYSLYNRYIKNHKFFIHQFVKQGELKQLDAYGATNLLLILILMVLVVCLVIYFKFTRARQTFSPINKQQTVFYRILYSTIISIGALGLVTSVYLGFAWGRQIRNIRVLRGVFVTFILSVYLFAFLTPDSIETGVGFDLTTEEPLFPRLKQPEKVFDLVQENRTDQIIRLVATTVIPLGFFLFYVNALLRTDFVRIPSASFGILLLFVALMTCGIYRMYVYLLRIFIPLMEEQEMYDNNGVLPFATDMKRKAKRVGVILGIGFFIFMVLVIVLRIGSFVYDFFLGRSGNDILHPFGTRVASLVFWTKEYLSILMFMAVFLVGANLASYCDVFVLDQIIIPPEITDEQERFKVYRESKTDVYLYLVQQFFMVGATAFVMVSTSMALVWLSGKLDQQFPGTQMSIMYIAMGLALPIMASTYMDWSNTVIRVLGILLSLIFVFEVFTITGSRNPVYIIILLAASYQTIPKSSLNWTVDSPENATARKGVYYTLSIVIGLLWLWITIFLLRTHTEIALVFAHMIMFDIVFTELDIKTKTFEKSQLYSHANQDQLDYDDPLKFFDMVSTLLLFQALIQFVKKGGLLKGVVYGTKLEKMGSQKKKMDVRAKQMLHSTNPSSSRFKIDWQSYGLLFVFGAAASLTRIYIEDEPELNAYKTRVQIQAHEALEHIKRDIAQVGFQKDPNLD